MKKLLSVMAVCCLLLTTMVGCQFKDILEDSIKENIKDNIKDNLWDNAEDGVNGGVEEGANGGTENGVNGGTEGNGTEAPADTDFVKDEDDMLTNRDEKTDYTESDSITIELRGSSAAASSNSVKISGSTVTITENKTHIISGTLDNGQLIVNAPETAKLQLVFKNVSITSESSAPLYIVEADKVFLTLEGKNTLENGGAFSAIDANNIDGAIFSKQDLTINGTGSLTVTSPAGHGIVCKDDLVMTGGTYTINSAAHAVQANDSIRINDITLTATAGKDALHAENTEDTALGFIWMSSGTLNLTAEGDGISAGSYVDIQGGKISILAGGGYENGDQQSSSDWGGFPGGSSRPPMPRTMSATVTATTSTTDDASTSMKGIKATGKIAISSGTFDIDSADDAIHSNASLTISGGKFSIASGDDAIHAEETLTVSAGTIEITQSYEGLEALHIYVKGGSIKLKASDDGLNAAGGTDSSGSGGRDEMFGGAPGGMSANSNGSISISGGTLAINASGDGIDANGTLEISGGHTTVTGPTQGDTAVLDYDKTGVITGGTFIGTGGANMAQSLSGTNQGVIFASVGSQSAGTKITLTDSSGSVVLTHEPELSLQLVVISTPKINSGERYTLTVGSKTLQVTAG